MRTDHRVKMNICFPRSSRDGLLMAKYFRVSFITLMMMFSHSLSYAQSADEDSKTPAAGGAASIPEGRELVNMDFPELTDIKDIIKAVALWTGKNVILDRNVTGKVQIISPKKVTKEEAYQAFLSALNMLNLTTVETGKVIKVLKVRNAVKGNLKTYLGSSWAPRTDEIITQIIPLKYIDAKQVQTTLSRIVSTNSMIAYEPTNTLIISESGYKVRRVLEILELLDVQTQQPKVLIVPIKYSDPKNIADKVTEILRASGGSSRKKSRSPYHSFKILTDDRANSIIIFGPPRTIQDIKNLVKKFDIPIDDPIAQASIHVRPLDYADAKKLAGTLSSLTSAGKRSNLRRPPIKRATKSGIRSKATVADLGEGLKITADESSNSLLITGNRSAYEALNTIIRKLDVRRSQVFVEADILDVNESNGFRFGTSIFAGAGGKTDSGTKTVTAWEAGRIGPLVVSQASATTGGTLNSKSVAEAFSSDMSIGILAGTAVNVPGLGTFRPSALINMIKTDTNTRVLASPHILTSNNEEASISVGEKVFFKSAATNPTTGAAISKVEKEDVDLSLNIKPNISHSNYVTLKLELDSNSIADITPEGLPRVSKRKTKQLVTVKNGQTVVISGLVNTTESESYSKIPLLGDIPLLGWLFRNSNISSKRSNLVIFLTPHIVHGAADLAAIYQAKLKDRDKFLEEIYGRGYQQSEFYKALPNEKDGSYNATSIDAAEERLREKQKSEVYRAIGYEGIEDEAPRKTQTQDQESAVTVPFTGAIGLGGGGEDVEREPRGESETEQPSAAFGTEGDSSEAASESESPSDDRPFGRDR